MKSVTLRGEDFKDPYFEALLLYQLDIPDDQREHIKEITLEVSSFTTK